MARRTVNPPRRRECISCGSANPTITKSRRGGVSRARAYVRSGAGWELINSATVVDGAFSIASGINDFGPRIGHGYELSWKRDDTTYGYLFPGTFVATDPALPAEPIHFTLPAPGALSGQVRAPDGTPAIAGTPVQMLRCEGGTPLTVTTDGSGAYRFPVVWPGCFYVSWFDLTSEYTVAGPMDEALTVNVNGDSVTADLTRPPGAVSGVITSERGASRSWVRVERRDPDPARAGLWTFVARVTTGYDGSFTVRGLEPGEYRIDALSVWRYGAVTSEPFVVDVGSAATVQLRLVEGLIAGRVDGAPPNSVGPGSVVATRIGDERYESGPIQPDGTFEITSLPAGVYELTLTSSFSGATHSWRHPETITITDAAATQDHVFIRPAPQPPSLPEVPPSGLPETS